MKKIIHITYDLRDRKGDEVTTAVGNLIQASGKDSQPLVIDLVRVANPKRELVRLIDPSHLSINVFGLPYGFSMSWTQNRAFNFINQANSDGLINLDEIEVVHAHKLTFEGMIGFKLSKQLDIPLLMTLRQTDIMVFTKNPLMIKKFIPVLEESTNLIYLIPQILKKMKEIFGESFFSKHIHPKSVLLPNIIDKTFSDKNLPINEKTFVTILRMTKKSVRRKNLKRLLLAIKLLGVNEVKLKIVGDGSYRPTVQKWVQKFGLKDRIVFEGTVPNEKIDVHLIPAQAFVLPSFSESFGMVYAEALLNGTPIMFSKDHLGFDGYYEGVGVGVNPNSVESIKSGLENLLQNGLLYRKNINALRESGEFEIFSSKFINSKYKQIIENC